MSDTPNMQTSKSQNRERRESTGPTIGIVIPTHNRPESTVEAIRSVIGQLLDGDRLVVVDNGSTDSTPEWARAAGAEVIFETQRGPGAARNAGVAHLDTDWVTFLDSDDLGDDSWLCSLRNKISSARDAGIVFSSVKYKNSGKIINPENHGIFFQNMCSNFLCSSYAVRRSIFIAAGGFDTGLRFGENTELGIRLAAAVVSAQLRGVTLQHVTALIRDGASVRTSRNEQLILDALEITIAKHYALFDKDRQTLVSYLNFAGVVATRLGFRARALGHFTHATFQRPTSKTLARAVSSALFFDAYRAFLVRRRQEQ